MRHRFSRNLFGAATLAVAVGAFPPATGAADQPFLEEKIIQLFGDLENGTLAPEAARSECLLGIVDSEDAESLRQVMSTYLEVSRSTAIPAFCNALVAAVAGGSFKAEEFRPLINGRDKAAEAYTVGRLLRVVYMTHNGFDTILVSGAAKP